MYDELRTADDKAPTEGAGEPLDAQTDHGSRRGFWSGLGDVILSIPAGVAIRIGG